MSSNLAVGLNRCSQAVTPLSVGVTTLLKISRRLSAGYPRDLSPQGLHLGDKPSSRSRYTIVCHGQLYFVGEPSETQGNVKTKQCQNADDAHGNYPLQVAQGVIKILAELVCHKSDTPREQK